MKLCQNWKLINKLRYGDLSSFDAYEDDLRPFRADLERIDSDADKLLKLMPDRKAFVDRQKREAEDMVAQEAIRMLNLSEK